MSMYKYTHGVDLYTNFELRSPPDIESELICLENSNFGGLFSSHLFFLTSTWTVSYLHVLSYPFSGFLFPVLPSLTPTPPRLPTSEHEGRRGEPRRGFLFR